VWNAVLSTAFPPVEGFVVKPQCKIRPEIDTGLALELLSETGRLSFDSDGGLVAPRGGGRERVGIPDFVVASTSGYIDVPVLIVEVKRVETGLRDSVVQLRDYMGAVANRGRLDYIRGLLIAGPEAQMYRLNALTMTSTLEQDWCPAAGEAMYAALRRVAGSHQPPAPPDPEYQTGPGEPPWPLG